VPLPGGGCARRWLVGEVAGRREVAAPGVRGPGWRLVVLRRGARACSVVAVRVWSSRRGRWFPAVLGRASFWSAIGGVAAVHAAGSRPGSVR
jgi:hypothetical protein